MGKGENKNEQQKRKIADVSCRILLNFILHRDSVSRYFKNIFFDSKEYSS